MTATAEPRPARIRSDAVAGSNGNGHPGRAVAPLQVGLLGGFRAERVGIAPPVSGWQRRSAKTLTKLLATYPRHALHREQILDMLWPNVEVESALNTFGKALYAARRALEPELLPRESSAYLRLSDSMVALNTEHVAVDADHFQHLAEDALRRRDAASCESALAVYGGELLPEDRYEDWCAERRDFLANLRIRLLLGLADAREQGGAHGAVADCLREVLQQDPTREDVHRRLMVLYAAMGTRDKAVRQFHICRDVLGRELGLVPEKATVAAFQDVVDNRIPRQISRLERDLEVVTRQQPRPDSRAPTPLVGRDSVLEHLGKQLTRAAEGKGRMILVSGEAGVGKTRLLAEFATAAQGHGAAVLWGGSGAHTNHLAYGPFAEALEDYAASRPDLERNDLAQRYPPLVHFVPSLGLRKQLPPMADRPGDDHLYLVPAIVRLMTELARTRPVVLVMGDLHELHPSSLDLLQYLADLAVQRRWLIIGASGEEGLKVGSELWRLIETSTREGLCLPIQLEPLTRADCDQLVRTVLQGGDVAAAVLDYVYQRSLGNPLFAEELVREMRERDELLLSNGSWRTGTVLSESVPPRVRAVAAMRVAPMEENVRRVLSLAAAASEMGISLTDLRSGAAALEPPVSDAALLDALDRALEIRILEERNDTYKFRHPLLRAALYEHLPKHRRDQLQAALSHAAA